MAENVRKAVADALGIFYRNHLEPRFDRIDKKLTEHDEKFGDILGHFDHLYQRVPRLEELRVMGNGKGRASKHAVLITRYNIAPFKG